MRCEEGGAIVYLCKINKRKNNEGSEYRKEIQIARGKRHMAWRYENDQLLWTEPKLV
jgi:hypothetical protein